MTRRFTGVDGVLDAYKAAINSITLYGPTNFGPSISEFVHKASMMQAEGRQYQILLIITDGAITDMQKTKELIIKVGFNHLKSETNINHSNINHSII